MYVYECKMFSYFVYGKKFKNELINIYVLIQECLVTRKNSKQKNLL